MKKIVYNDCFGGFSLSVEAMKRYAEIKGIKLYVEGSGGSFYTYWTVAPEDRVEPLEGNAWNKATMEERQASNANYDRSTLSDRDMERDDPVLVQVVEELGEKASGMCSNLKIKELPEGTLYRIDEYDGNESVRN